MKPKPFESLNHLTVPVAIETTPSETGFMFSPNLQGLAQAAFFTRQSTPSSIDLKKKIRPPQFA
jgi:hypothetical protein